MVRLFRMATNVSLLDPLVVRSPPRSCAAPPPLRADDKPKPPPPDSLGGRIDARDSKILAAKK